jgi:hypothetical protein
MLARDDIYGYEDDDLILTALDIYRFLLVIVVFLRTRLECTCSTLLSVSCTIHALPSNFD